MPIWSTAPVSQTPAIKIRSWQVAEVEGISRHIVGYNITEGEGRVSSQVVDFDAATRVATTRSGRRYELCGSPGYNSDAMYTFDRWCQINGADRDKVEYVTEEYVVALPEPPLV